MTSLTSSPDTRRRTSYGVAIVLVAQLMLVLDVTVVNVALPRIQTDLSFSPAGLSWVLNGYTLAFGGLLLLGGRLGDVFGRLRVFELGLGLFTIASLAGGLAPTPDLLVVARVAQGVGAAIAAPSVLALLTTSTPDAAARNRALALFTAVSSAGGSLGLILGGALTDLGSWRWTLVINVPIGIAVLALARVTWSRPRVAPVDSTWWVRRRQRWVRSPSRPPSSTHPITAGPRSAPLADSRWPRCCLHSSSAPSASRHIPCCGWVCCAIASAPARSWSCRCSSARSSRCSSCWCSTTNGCSDSVRWLPALRSCH